MLNLYEVTVVTRYNYMTVEQVGESAKDAKLEVLSWLRYLDDIDALDEVFFFTKCKDKVLGTITRCINEDL